jgi:hypothetical protein
LKCHRHTREEKKTKEIQKTTTQKQNKKNKQTRMKNKDIIAKSKQQLCGSLHDPRWNETKSGTASPYYAQQGKEMVVMGGSSSQGSPV